MKRLRPAYVIVAVLLLAVSSMPTSLSALSENLEFSVSYYVGGDVVGVEVYNSCFGQFDYSWGQQGGTLKREQYTYCDSGSTSCYWYSWNGSEWVLVNAGDCSPDGELPGVPV